MGKYMAYIRFDPTTQTGLRALPRLENYLAALPGVEAAELDRLGAGITVTFQHEHVGLSDLVRLIEEHECTVRGVAQRPVHEAAAVDAVGA